MKITLLTKEDLAAKEPPKSDGPAPRKKGSSVRHTRAIQRDRSKRPPAAPPAEAVTERLAELIHPATLAQLDHFRALGLRERVLTLPVMVALVLSMVWRQIGSVAELHRLLERDGLLWTAPTPVRRQSLLDRLRTFPASLFERMLTSVLPVMHERWAARERPLPPELAWARARYTAVLAADGSTLDALLRQVGLLRDLPDQPLSRSPAGCWPCSMSAPGCPGPSGSSPIPRRMINVSGPSSSPPCRPDAGPAPARPRLHQLHPLR